jgi:Holliday junction resolvasome RuvABC endonuclease subunit
MRIIAFDLGKNFAWAWRYPAGHFCTGHVVLEGIRSHKLGMLARLLPPILGYGYDLVIYETPFARGRDATRTLWGIAGVIEAAATNASIACVDASTPTIKKFAGGHGRASKEDMIAAAQKLGYQGTNEHEADAVCLLAYAEANTEKVK